MRRCLIVLLALGAVLAAAAEPALAQKRIALLIGNKSYAAEVGALKNPHNDIELMSGALKAIGFDSPTLMKDARRSQILVAVNQYAARVAAAGPGAIGFLYYSGHGAASEGTNTNYLIPVDASDPNSASFWYESVRLEEITRLILDRAPHAAHFVVFDACRNELKLPDKTASKGFATVPTLRGMFVAFASEFGRTASDVGEKSGPYAAALAAEMVKPGQSHLDLFQNVKEAVTRQTGGRQSPWELNGLSQRVRLGPDAVAAPAPAAPPSYAGGGEAERAWGLVKDSTNVGVLEAFAKRYSDTFFADLARARIEELKKQQVAIAVPPPAQVPVPSKPAQPTVAVTPVPPPARCEGVETQVGNERRCLKPKESFKDCPDCPEMVVIPAGEFMMGSPTGEEAHQDNEGPVRKVTLAKPFGVGKFEATFAEWDACVAAGGCKYKPEDKGWGRGKRPVIDVSWDDAKEYMTWLSKKTGRTYRLLTEAEWEYAARAGTTTPFSTGRTITTDQANFHGEATYGGSAKGVYRGKTIEVGSLSKPNAFGLHDMHGNAYEWVEDCYQDTYNGAPTDGSAKSSASCSPRVLRGGSWSSYPRGLRSAIRFKGGPNSRIFNLGFRVARTL